MGKGTYLDKQMRAEARELMKTAVEKGRVLAVDDMVAAIVRRHPGVSGDDVEWYRSCAYGWTRYVLRNCMRGVDGGPDVEEDDDQLVINAAGFERLRMGYFIDRGGRKFVPLSLMTSAECREKAAEYEAYSAGALIHAQELRRYADQIDN